MTTDIFHYFDYLAGNPLAAVTAILTLGVILVNGWTDAPTPLQPAWQPVPSARVPRSSWRRFLTFWGWWP